MNGGRRVSRPIGLLPFLFLFTGNVFSRILAGQKSLLSSVRKREPNALASGNRAKNGLVHVFSDRA
jgi:hypothetical protein